MRAFYGDRFSPNMTKTPEGFLICHNVPIARTGTQDYLPRELGQSGGGLIHVHRYAEDVFRPETLASFEGKPVTDDHPPKEVDPSNYGAYMKGVTQNVRRQGEHIVADLIIHDAVLISEIEAGKREISCGYECNYVEDGGDFKQTNIIGNHVAVVTHGRAGKSVSIKDQKPERRKKMAKKNILDRMFAAFVKDADEDEIAEASEAVQEAKAKDEDEKEEAKDEGTDVEELAKTVDSLARTVDSLVGIMAAQNRGRVRTALDELEEELAEDEDEPEEEEITEDEGEEPNELPPEEIEDEDTTEEEKPEQAKDKAIALAAIRAVKPIIAKLPAKDRQAANDAMGKAIRKAMGKRDTQPLPGGYGALTQRSRTTDSLNAQANLRAFGEACRRRNPHLKKEEK